jgi:hypothetical protein
MQERERALWRRALAREEEETVAREEEETVAREEAETDLPPLAPKLQYSENPRKRRKCGIACYR